MKNTVPEQEGSSIETANAQQKRYWNSTVAAPWVKLQTRLDTLFEPLSQAALSEADAKAGERVIDVGCGCGVTSLALAERVGPSGNVYGVDVSAPMLTRAKERADMEGLSWTTFSVGDAATHPFPPEHFQLVFSRLGAMFFGDPVSAFANLHAALTSAGRMLLACPRRAVENPYITAAVQAARPFLAPGALTAPAPAQPGMFSLAEPDRIQSVLTRAGFQQVRMTSIDLQMKLGANPAEAADFSVQFGPLAGALDTQSRETQYAVLDAITHAYANYAGPDGISLQGGFWLIAARK